MWAGELYDAPSLVDLIIVDFDFPLSRADREQSPERGLEGHVNLSRSEFY